MFGLGNARPLSPTENTTWPARRKQRTVMIFCGPVYLYAFCRGGSAAPRRSRRHRHGMLGRSSRTKVVSLTSSIRAAA